MRFHLCTLTSSATALSLLLLTNSSSADRKSYHGAGCIFSRAHSTLDYVPQYSYRGAFNDGTADQEDNVGKYAQQAVCGDSLHFGDVIVDARDDIAEFAPHPKARREKLQVAV